MISSHLRVIDTKSHSVLIDETLVLACCVSTLRYGDTARHLGSVMTRSRTCVSIFLSEMRYRPSDDRDAAEIRLVPTLVSGRDIRVRVAEEPPRDLTPATVFRHGDVKFAMTLNLKDIG